MKSRLGYVGIIIFRIPPGYVTLEINVISSIKRKGNDCRNKIYRKKEKYKDLRLFLP